MGLYIAGLRMPKPGTYTKFTVYSDGRVVLHFGGKYIGDAVEVKKPHCRLIDAGTAYDMIAETEHAGNYVDMDAVTKGLDNTPTIIEAEGENEHNR